MALEEVETTQRPSEHGICWLLSLAISHYSWLASRHGEGKELLLRPGLPPPGVASFGSHASDGHAAYRIPLHFPRKLL
jgi:hypothetical protein